MDYIAIIYQGNNSVCYDDKEFLERRSKLRRLKRAKGNLRVGEEVTIRTKNRLWKAIVKDTNPEASQRGRKRKREGTFDG